MTNTWRWLAWGPLQTVSLVGAGLWSVGLLVAASTVPAYETATASSTGSISTHGETLVGENGASILIVLAVPLAATLTVAVALLLRRRWALWTACVIAGVLALLNLLAMLTVGIFVLPVTGALVVACLCDVLRRPPTERTVGLVDGASSAE